MAENIYGITGSERQKISIEGTIQAGADASLDELKAKQAATEDALLNEQPTSIAFAIKQEKLQRPRSTRSTERAKRVQGSIFIRKEEADELADQFSGRQGNKEYHLDPLILSFLAQEELGAGINEESSPDQIIAIIRQRMTINGRAPDVSIVDKAFEFLIEVTTLRLNNAPENEKPRIALVLKQVETAKDNHHERYKIDIEVAQKIIGAVDAVSQATGMELKDTLDLYRQRIHNPPDLQTLRKYYEEKGYKFMKLELKGFSTYLGGNFKRNDLENAELMQLAQSARQMQALFGVLRQAKSQLSTMEHFLELNGIIRNEAAA